MVIPFFYVYFANCKKLHEARSDSLDGRASSKPRVTALDPSENLLNEIEDSSIKKVVGQMPDTSLGLSERFSFIRMSFVLHQLVEKPSASRDASRTSLTCATGSVRVWGVVND